MIADPIRVLIVDDSRTIRALLRNLLSRDPRIEVAGEAADPFEARDAIKRLAPHVVTLDVEMPRMNGLEFLANLMRLRPLPVVMVSSLTNRGSAAAIKALQLGAIECLDREELQRDVAGGSRLCEVILAAAGARFTPRETVQAPLRREDYRPDGRILMIGSSTGGVDALERIFSRFPETCPPTLVSQHMPPAFLASFAARLNETLRPKVRLAATGDRVETGTILLAPGGNTHLALIGSAAAPRVALVPDDGTHTHIPSVDAMFASALPRARGVVAAILTGMGRDGAAGLLALRQAGAHTFAQSGESCVVDGMPRVARELGAAMQVVPLERMGDALLGACGEAVEVAQ